MQPTDLASATAPSIHDVPAKFMIEPATYQRGGELGFTGMDFYVAGRGGVLGEVIGDVVAAAFVFFEPAMINDAWNRSAPVMPRADATLAFAECGYSWARANLADDEAERTVAEVATKVINAASPAGAPMFAAQRALAVPSSVPEAAFHQLNVLRELRAAKHGAAVLSVGLTPLEAMAVREPNMAAIFGWTGVLPPVGEISAQWQAAEDATDLAMGSAFEVLEVSEAEAFATACSALRAKLDG